jgi:uncharacterized protein (DUF433 family)
MDIAMTATDRIEVNPAVMMGKPVIRGTRIPFELILRKLAEGATEADLLDAYPRLTTADLRAAIGFCSRRDASGKNRQSGGTSEPNHGDN